MPLTLTEKLDSRKWNTGDNASVEIVYILTGTFNAAALLGLQAGGLEDRIANATERTAKGVEGLRQDAGAPCGPIGDLQGSCRTFSSASGTLIAKAGSLGERNGWRCR